MRKVKFRARRPYLPVFSLSTFTLALLTVYSQGLAQDPTGRGTLNIRSVQGRVEQQQSGATWRPLNENVQNITLENALRTGTGRVILTNKIGGRTLVGSASRLRVYSGEADLQVGQFLLEGPGALFVLGSHVVMEGAGKVRIDLSLDGSVQRVAVIQGSVRLSNGSRLLTVTSGQQVALKTFQQTAFTENDPWYASIFAGNGSAIIEAVRGTVRWQASQSQGSQSQGSQSQGSQSQGNQASPQPARVGLSLNEGDGVSTASAAWAEIGFSGGGYLRLTEESELKVLAVEKTSRGREVVLQLLRGSAWNVVEKGQGGYKISTPVVSTAVRGTKFRVDATGMVKVMEGSVELPSNAGATVDAGQQKPPGAAVQPLQKDALDLFNEARDAERAAPLQLSLEPFRRDQRDFGLSFQGSSDVVIKATAQGRQGNATALNVVVADNLRQYQLSQADLPDGRYTVNIVASRFGEQRRWSTVLWIDHTPPSLSDLRRTARGQVVTLSGLAQDTSGRPMTVVIQAGSQRITRQTKGAFQFILPPALRQTPLEIELIDAAGNSAHAVLP